MKCLVLVRLCRPIGWEEWGHPPAPNSVADAFSFLHQLSHFGLGVSACILFAVIYSLGSQHLTRTTRARRSPYCSF